MKKTTTQLVLVLCAFFLMPFSYAQSGYIYTVVGNGLPRFAGDGGPATAASLNYPTDVCEDHAGNIYIADQGNCRIRRVDRVTGIISTIAGNGTNGYTGDGGPATAAKLDHPNGVSVDGHGNVYIADMNNNVIRQITVAGIISTFAGTGAPGFSGDGGLASAAILSAPTSVAVDAMGRVYIGDNGNGRIRMVDTTGIISTIVGGGTSVYTSGYAGTAIAIGDIHHLAVDVTGSVYFTFDNSAFLKYNSTTGIVTVVDTAYLPWGVGADIACNVYMATQDNSILKYNSTTGLVDTVVRQFAGASFSGDGGPAIDAGLADPDGIYADILGNLYITDQVNNRIRYITSSLVASYNADSFSIFINQLCNGPQVTVSTNHFVNTYTQKTFYGDGTFDSTAILMGYGGTAGYSTFNHTYSYTGTYSLKTVLYNDLIPIDSFSYTYEYIQCVAMPVKFYFDVNSNCVKDSGEFWNNGPLNVEVDSNGVVLDTLSCTSGFYYIAHGSPGDIYSFRVVGCDSGLFVACPASGVFYDTIRSGVFNEYLRMVGLHCVGGGFDLSAYGMQLTGRHMQTGNIYVANNTCTPVDAIVTLHYCSSYNGTNAASPSPSLSVDSSMSWTLSALNDFNGVIDINYRVDVLSSWLIPGDTVHTFVTVTPTTGDVDTTNNNFLVVDTVKSSYDPNEMEVTPGCIKFASDPVTLKYSIGFENTGNDTAHNIYVLDTLPANVDAKTLHILMASNQMFTSSYQDAVGHNILKFDFPAINLLDSSHHGQCDGAVMFNIKTKAGLPDTGGLNNRAGIYFDDNAVVMTNTATVGMGCIVSSVPNVAPDYGLTIKPNPATDQLNITFAHEQFQSYTISNSMGYQLLSDDLSGSSATINIKQLAPGIYYIRLTGDHGTDVRKFVKM